jgi:hypothetical protein
MKLRLKGDTRDFRSILSKDLHLARVRSARYTFPRMPAMKFEEPADYSAAIIELTRSSTADIGLQISILNPTAPPPFHSY